jgi:hypothetical protein
MEKNRIERKDGVRITRIGTSLNTTPAPKPTPLPHLHSSPQPHRLSSSFSSFIVPPLVWLPTFLDPAGEAEVDLKVIESFLSFRLLTLPFLATCLFEPPPLRLTNEGLLVNISTSTFVLFLLGVVGLDIELLEGGVGAVKEDDSGLFCNGIVVPGALPFDRGFGDEDRRLWFGFNPCFSGSSMWWRRMGGGRCGDLGGEG